MDSDSSKAKTDSKTFSEISDELTDSFESVDDNSNAVSQTNNKETSNFVESIEITSKNLEGG